MNCKKCGAPIENNSGFCGMCGTPVEPQMNAATDIFNMGAPVQPAEPAQPAAPVQPIIEPVQPMPEVTPVQPVVEPVQPSQPEIIEPVQPVVEPIQPMPTLESETIQQPNQLPIMDMNNGGVPPVNTPAQPSSYDIKPEKKKGSSLPIILIILILLGVGGYFAYKYFFNKPDKVVKGLVNKAYDKFEMPLKKYNDKTDSVLVDAELSINTNIDGLEDLNGMKFNLTTGIDYKNSKVEVGLAYLENNTKILEGMMYVIDKNAYMVLKDIYPNPLKLNTEEINFEEIASETTTATPEDIEYITKRLKDIFLESLNMNDFKQSSAKITLNGSETKVKKISYTLDEIKTQKLMNNMIDNILKDETLVNKLSAIYNTDSETLKELLEDSKVELSDSTSDETIEIAIYTKGITDDFAGMDIELPNGFKAKWNLENDDHWAVNPNSFEEVGCIHTCQGMEFDYVGVFIGKDLYYDGQHVRTNRNAISKDDKTSGIRKSSCLDLEADSLIRRTYKVLLSRGLKGCYIYCEDKALSDYLKKSINR